ncbi:MAG: RICIN domain-containing protein [Fibrella sp.]|nr:RICIN domain-containing protein [Armatimonadota bacterium]
MRIILKPGGIAALILGLSLLVGTVVYTRYTRTATSNQAVKADIASSRSVDSPALTNQPLEKINDTQRYWLVNRSTKLALDIHEKSAFDGAWTSPQAAGSSVTQQWTLRKNADDGSVTLVNANNGKSLQSLTTKVGGNISQGTLTKPASFGQRWVLQPDGEYYYLYNQNSRLVLGLGNLPGTTTEWGLQQKKASGNPMQHWQLVSVK